MPRQLIPEDKQLTEKVQFRTTKEINSELQLIARKKFRSKSYVICLAVEQYLKGLKDAEEKQRET